MAGHSKWANIQHRKGRQDKLRSKLFSRLSKEITVAAKMGMPDPDMNPRLRLAVNNAKSQSMPKDNIERAIKRGTGEIAGADYEEVNYEGYGPNGVAIFVEALTDNTNRTVADVRHLFSKHGGSMGQSGSVAYLFDRKGMIEIPQGDHDEMELLELVAEAGADDLASEESSFVVTMPVENFGAVQAALQNANVEIEEANLTRIATTTVKLEPDAAKRIVKLLDLIEELNDVQAVYSTLDFDEATIAALS